MSEESVDWDVMMPVIVGLSAFSSVVAVALVTYCYCKLKDQISPGSDYSRPQGTGRRSRMIDFRSAFSGAGSSEDIGGSAESPVDNAAIRRDRVRFSFGESLANSTPEPENEEEITEEPPRRGGRASRGGIRRAELEVAPTQRIQQNDDGSQDVFV
mmetsp:Transcript_43921/g.68731  ORF Transcript_43921/g.68731 Transcript_43921/m.68731 type:complete len:156 (+) Transcript_43921:273-740(+)|eukprot:CAMPEP_0184293190 /NCGR_PEP_ID=MMETSP1049-20130417/4718_1 /TAXON_ID=77928 /ORGANISM="Proteomonas sulcata, Strain CCMP704" /LENGTH=155 /DNA_ID=CAMNT_0026601127 /DNA_START=533 /DNA_END=1000 /DNA_ORIENTATION=-